MIVNLLTLLLKYKLLAPANQKAADCQSSPVQTSRMRITAITSNVHKIEFRQLCIPLCSVKMPGWNLFLRGSSTLARRSALGWRKANRAPSYMLNSFGIQGGGEGGTILAYYS